MLLESEGYEVVGEAPDGHTGIRVARELQPDVMLLDVHLPDIDGFEVAGRLTANGAAPAIVLVSSRSREDLAQAVESSGARGFINKADLTGAAVEALLA